MPNYSAVEVRAVSCKNILPAEYVLDKKAKEHLRCERSSSPPTTDDFR